MKFRTQKCLCLALITVLTPQFAFAQSPSSQKLLDVALHNNGRLVGQLVDTKGQAIADADVVIKQAKAVVAVAKTNKQGWFQVNGVRAGVYEIAAGKNTGAVRAWAVGTAPPVAHQAVQLVAGQEVYRGQIEAEGGGIGPAEVTAIGLGTAGVIIGIIALDDDAS